MKNFPFHIAFHQLADYVEGRLSLSERMQMEAHLATCEKCSAKVARLAALVGAMRTDTGEDAPQGLLDRVKKLFRSRPVLQAPATPARRRVPAVLHFDSMTASGGLHIRSGRAGTRQLLFSTGVDEIDLRIEPSGLVWNVSGQVLGESVLGGKAILQSSAGTIESDLNELSEFILPSVQAGTYTLILNLDNVEVEIEDLRIGL
ncbi:MAG TPA: zf-HC2 domain-containing protein [Anaerolineales bacterium]|nr:zf-HC2 domain-containing protein [Anaerolineales bacterium]